MKTNRELLRAIKQRPGMYLGRCCIIRLAAFLGGWRFAKGSDIADEDLFEGFHAWIAAKFHITSSHGWPEIILFFAQDSREAFERFWTLFDEFLQSRGLAPVDNPD